MAELFFALLLVSASGIFSIWVLSKGATVVSHGAAKVVTSERGKKVAIGTAKFAGKTAGKLAWMAFKQHMGIGHDVAHKRRH